MTALDQIAFFQDRRDEVPNQELARQLAAARDTAGIQEIAAGLQNKNPAIQSDCLKVLYETAYRTPELVADVYPQFLALLDSRNNRLVWGAMIALAAVTPQRAAELAAHVPQIQRAMQAGSVITVDNGVKVLSALAASSESLRAQLFPFLLEHLGACRPKDVPQHAEFILPVVDAGRRAAFTAALQARLGELSPAQAARVRKVLKAVQSIPHIV